MWPLVKMSLTPLTYSIGSMALWVCESSLLVHKFSCQCVFFWGRDLQVLIKFLDSKYMRTTELKVQESPLWAEDLKLREGEHTQVTALLSAKEWGGQMWAQPLTPSCSRTSYVPFFLRRSSPLWTRDNCTFLTGLLQGLKEMRHVKCLGYSKCSINICYYMIVGFLGRLEK